MRGSGRLQKVLYLIMAVLGIYILYKVGAILLESRPVQQTLDSGELQRRLEDAAVQTWAPGYAASVEERDVPDWMAVWMRQLTPVYSYLADGQAGQQADPGTAAKENPEGGQVGQQSDPGIAMEENPEDGQAGQQSDSGIAAEEAPEGGQPETNGRVQSSQQTGQREKDLDGGEKTDPGDGQTEAPKSEGQEVRTETEPGEESAGQAGTDSRDTQEADGSLPAAGRTIVSEELLHQLEDYDYLLANYYTVDEGTMADTELLDADALLGEDLRLAQNPSVPQILIYHTHSQEAFLDSEEGAVGDSIVGMGEVLAQELQNTYGYNVIHDTGVYDLVDGLLDRSAAYDYAREAVEQLLQENPSIEVIIDLHRDGVDGAKFVTEIDGQPTSMIMFFNGISRDSQDQPLSWLENPYIQQNLAFSLQLQLAARQKYPGFTRNIYLKAERFNLHLRPRSLLIEAGTQLNTVKEERNAMRPLAELLHQVLSGETR